MALPDPQSFIERLRSRDASLWSHDRDTQISIRDRLGWVNVHETIALRLTELTEFADWVRGVGFRHAVLIGMGGSSLAPEVLQRTFGSARGYPELIVLDTTDPFSILRVENRIDVETTLFIVSSKSGGTIETASLHKYFAERTRDATGDIGALDNFVAVTDPETILHERAREEGFHRVFINPPDIGGRFSALSFFGLVPAAAIGVDIRRLLASASAVDAPAAVQLGYDLAEHAQAGRDKLTFAPSPGLESFGAWAEQLIAESTGKHGKGIIPVDGEPLAAPLVYGEDRVFVALRMAGESSESDVALRTLENAGRPVIPIEVPGPYAIGGEFLRWEIATAAIGAVLGINPFDEPNVSESKDNTAQVLERFASDGTLPDVAPEVEEDGTSFYTEGDTLNSLHNAPDQTIGGLVAEHFRQAPEDAYLALMAFIPRTEEHDRLLGRLRIALRDATHRATTLGYGPRFLHSTGQLHKGGPATGVFLQLTMEDEIDIDIPGEPGVTFGILKRAQALGDLKALIDRRRRVVRVSLGQDVTENLCLLVETVEAALRATAKRGD
ncbi:MAG TPA: glucose-6-phosphate isomerase [Dehalococcoidia bacterium]|nr:glucose-6-phosphate isomerase [Dehalococcoidia bacterium]